MIVPDVCTSSSTYPDPQRAQAIYEEAFRRAFEYIFSSRLEGGAVAEFGTFMGFTARILASLIKEFEGETEWYPGNPECHLYLFDSFRGFPRSDNPIDQNCYEIKYNNEWKEGMESVPEGTADAIRAYLSRILPPSRLTIVEGYYGDVLPRNTIREKISLLHLDCDLYSSTKTILDHFIAQDKFQDGTVVMCDDYNCNRANPGQGQRRALRDTLGAEESPYMYSEFFSYGWHGRAFFLHKK